ncbi:MAG: S-layer homology domain-containing protein, partial [Firmicutes bacterium]|nr:S-layer homology domain-containing protein [Bacillota bacterium]
ADGKLTWNVSVAKGDSVTVSFKVQVNEDVDGDTVINKAVVRIGENDHETNEVINPTTEHILDTDNHFGYIIGYPVDYETGEKTDDKNRWPVRPTADITRAEVSTVFFRMLRDEKRSEYWTKENDFSDVSKSNWYNNAISVMASLGILKGYNDGTFQPNKAITRAEMAAIAARFARMTGADVTTTNTFTDIEGHWAKKEIEFAAAVGWINGYPDGSFHPQDNITRAEFMTLANRMLERQPELESDLLKDEMIAWPDNLPSDWWYLAVQEATNSHKYIRKGVTVPNLTFEYESWIEMLEMRDWSAFEKEWSDANSASNPGDIVSGGGE